MSELIGKSASGLPFCGSVGLVGAPMVVLGANRLNQKRRVE